MTYALRTGVISTAGSVSGATASSAATSGESRRTTGRPSVSTAASTPARAVVTSARGAASASMYRVRSAGRFSSTGRYAAPATITASSVTIMSTERGTATATTSSGPTPRAISRWASRKTRRPSSE